MVQKFQSDKGGGGGQEKQRTLLANKTRGLVMQEGEGGRSKLALGARDRVRSQWRRETRTRGREGEGERDGKRGDGEVSSAKASFPFK